MKPFTPAILRFDSLPSTNLEAANRATGGADEGLCVVAAEQTQGRGRLGRQWSSPKGAGLYFTVLLRPAFPKSYWPLLTLMTAVAVQDALLQSCELPTDIKWPNDVLADDKKLCGILAETVETTIGSAVIVGIGINLTGTSVPSELETVATSVEGVTGVTPDLEQVLKSLIATLNTRYQELQMQDGRARLVEEWCRRSSYCSGKRVSVSDGAGSFVGTTRGLQKDGALLVETDDGQLKVVRAGDVSGVRALNDSAPLAGKQTNG